MATAQQLLFESLKQYIDEFNTGGVTQTMIRMVHSGAVDNLQRVQDWFKANYPLGHLFALTPSDAKRSRPMIGLRDLLAAGARPMDPFGKPTPYFVFTYLAPTPVDLDACRVAFGISDKANYARLTQCGFLALPRHRRPRA